MRDPLYPLCTCRRGERWILKLVYTSTNERSSRGKRAALDRSNRRSRGPPACSGVPSAPQIGEGKDSVRKERGEERGEERRERREETRDERREERAKRREPSPRRTAMPNKVAYVAADDRPGGVRTTTRTSTASRGAKRRK